MRGGEPLGAAYVPNPHARAKAGDCEFQPPHFIV
jgi:hypothetical protein